MLHKGLPALAVIAAIACAPAFAAIYYVDGEGSCSISTTLTCTLDANCPGGETCEDVGQDTATCGRGTCSTTTTTTCAVNADCPGVETCVDVMPCLTLQWTYDQRVDFADGLDEIRVMPGTYPECPFLAPPSPATPKPVELRAQAFIDSGDRTATVLTGLDTCDGAPNPEFPVISIGHGTVVEGFTIENGGLSGVEAFGGVTITNNIIRDNRSSGEAGGIFLYTANCDYGDVTATISLNDVVDNRADGDGGGVSVLAVGLSENLVIDPPCGETGDSEVTIQANNIERNFAEGREGGGLRLFTFTDDFRSSEVVVTQNLIRDNVMSSVLDFGYGGGLFAQTYGYGYDRIEITGNTVLDNVSSGDGGGMSAWMDAFFLTQQSMVVEGNTVDNNEAGGNGGGIDAFIQAVDVQSDQGQTMSVADNTVTGNFSQSSGGIGGGGGILGTLFSTRTDSPGLVFSIVGNEVTDNINSVAGGGVGLFIAAEADEDTKNGVGAAPATAQIDVAHNLIRGNSAADATSMDAVGGGVSAVLQAFEEADANAVLAFNTIVTNFTDVGAGGIHVETNTGFGSANQFEGAARLEVSHSIIADNDGWAIGGPEPGTPGVFGQPGGSGNLTILSNFNDYFGNELGMFDPEIEPVVVQTGDVTVDPMLDGTGVSSLCQRIGHPRPSALPDVNTDDFVDGLDVLRIAVAFASASGSPRYSAQADIDGDGMVDGNDLALVTAMDAFATGCP